MNPDFVPLAQDVPGGSQHANGLLLRAFLAGTAAFSAGGVVWAAVFLLTGYAVGYVATGVGLLSGFAMRLAIRNRRDQLSERDWTGLAILAPVSAIPGLLLGKFIMYLRPKEIAATDALS